MSNSSAMEPQNTVVRKLSNISEYANYGIPSSSENPLDFTQLPVVNLTVLTDEEIYSLTKGNRYYPFNQMTIKPDPDGSANDLDERFRKSAVENTNTWLTHETSVKIEHTEYNVLSTIKTEPLDTYEEEMNNTAVSNSFETFHERYSCPMCYEDFDDYESFVIHKHTEHNAHQNKPYTCQVCNEKFLLSAHLNLHMVNHVDLLMRQSSSTPAIDYHPSSESDLTNKNNLKKSSKKSKHENDSIQIYSKPFIKPFKCPNCIFASKSETKFMQHQQICTTIFQQTCTTFSENSSTTDCDLCEKSFMNRTALNGHMRYHSLRGEIVSRRQYALNIGNQKNIEHCVDDSQNTSINTRKTNNKPKTIYKCKDCSKVFISRQKLFIHYQQHEKQMFCNMCNKQFFLYKRYQKHLLKHETDYQINNNNRSTLLDNQKVSDYKSIPKTNRFKVKIINSKRPNYKEPPKPFQCLKCKRHYSSKKSLTEHIRLYHKLAKKRHIPKMASTPCNWCRAVITTNNLHRHIKTCHPTVKSVSCTQCTSKFRDFPALKLHISEFHKNQRLNQI